MAHPLAGKAAPPDRLVDVDRLVCAYHARVPDPDQPAQRVAFGTSGHRGSSLDVSFNEAHILAITQAVCDHRRRAGIDGPLFLARDTHALSLSAERTALEVLAANEVMTVVPADGSPTPTPVVSHAILAHNRGRTGGLADAIIVTPSHNPPEDGGVKYNPPHGGPADTDVTDWIQERGNTLLASGNRDVRRIPLERVDRAATVRRQDLTAPYVADLDQVVDLAAIAGTRLRLAVDPLGGAGLSVWPRIAESFQLDLAILNPVADPRFSFVPLDHDGRIRMDCSSAHAMAGVVASSAGYHLAFGNDADADRHGIVVPGAGLMNPNHYLAVAIRYLFTHRPEWQPSLAVGKTLVSSAIIDRVATSLGRALREVPVGFKWFVSGLREGSLAFAGEESAGASFLRRDGRVWTTEKDGILLALLAAEILACTGIDPVAHYRDITSALGQPHYVRLDVPCTPDAKARLKRLQPAAVRGHELAGDPIDAVLTHAPGNGAAIGGLKVATAHGWFAARPSGTENIYKIYAESFRGPEHLDRIVNEAQSLVISAVRA